MPKTSAIHIDVSLNDEKVPENITWNATDSSAANINTANAMMLSFWDNAEKSAMRIDLWTRKMMVDEMADFFYQTLLGMADTYHRATKDDELSGELKNAAGEFMKKFKAKQKPASDLK
ncbi:MAG TPA: gliding motility protein GldC [Chitinophagaceae bacterium]|jgi:gliding motility-associated protein GldC|nr:gliding motility protein GldC [Chitinophagaceae bacterium]